MHLNKYINEANIFKAKKIFQKKYNIVNPLFANNINYLKKEIKDTDLI
jgi:hypothetical protein